MSVDFCRFLWVSEDLWVAASAADPSRCVLLWQEPTINFKEVPKFGHFGAHFRPVQGNPSRALRDTVADVCRDHLN